MVRALKVVSSRTAIDDMEFIEQVLWDAGGRMMQGAFVNKLRYRLGTRRYILECLNTLLMAGRLERKHTGTSGVDWLLRPREKIEPTSDETIAEIHAELDEARDKLELRVDTRRRHEQEAKQDPVRAAPLAKLGGAGGAKGGDKGPLGSL